MNIYIAKDGSTYGPFVIDQVRRQLNDGKWDTTDLAWYEGLADWVPLAQILNGSAPGAEPPTAPRPYSAGGVAPASPRAPLVLRLITAVVIFAPLFPTLTVIFLFAGLIGGFLIFGAPISGPPHDGGTFQGGYQAGHQAGTAFGKAWGPSIYWISSLLSLIVSILLAWRIAFSNFLPWCRAR